MFELHGLEIGQSLSTISQVHYVLFFNDKGNRICVTILMYL